ncbi:MAG: CNNM domain-containing protein, partial [Cyanobacteriota bacterium]
MRLLAAAILLALLAFFAAAEFALIRLRPSRVQQLVEAGSEGAAAVARLQRRLRRVLITTQLGMVRALLALGWTGRGLAGTLAAWLGRPDQQQEQA